MGLVLGVIIIRMGGMVVFNTDLSETVASFVRQTVKDFQFTLIGMPGPVMIL